MQVQERSARELETLLKYSKYVGSVKHVVFVSVFVITLFGNISHEWSDPGMIYNAVQLL